MELTQLALKYMELGGRLIILLNNPKPTDEQKHELASVDREMKKVSAEMWRARCTS